MDNVCNRRLFSIPSKVEMAEEQEYLCSQHTGDFSGQESLQIFHRLLRHRYACHVRTAQQSALQGLI